MSLVIDEHRQYLEDGVRVGAFSRAIGESVRPGDVVLDLGSGTAIQSLLACRAGARRVYAVDSGSIVALAREIVAANGFAERVTFVRGVSTRVSLPEKVDVITGDQIGRFGFEAGLLEYFADARDRFLKPGGRIVPRSVALEIAALELPELWARVAFWTARPAGFDFSPVEGIAVNTGYPAAAAPSNVVSSVLPVATVDLATATVAPMRVAGELRVARDGVVHGLGGWFTAQLSESATMTNSPLAAQRINRAHVFLPLAEPLPVSAGATLSISVHILPSDHIISWSIGGNGRRRLHQSTLRGMLLASDDLAKSQPGFKPRLTPWGAARRTVLALCDGQRPVAEIESALQSAYPSLFRSRDEAAVFVAEVIQPYAE